MRKPVRNDEAKYRTIDSLSKEVNLCNNTVLRLAREADAVIKVGRTTRVNSERFFEYLEREYKS